MKNKKLFAILTLVCFMFTLMPVAAFAAGEYVAVTGGKDVVNTEVDKEVLAVICTPSDKVGTTESYYFWAEDGEGDVVALGGDKGNDFTFETADTYYVYAVKADAKGIAKAAFEDTKLTKAEVVEVVKDRCDANIVDDCLTVKVKMGDVQYVLDTNLEGDKLVIEADNGWTYDGKVVVSLVKNNEAKTPVKGEEITFTSSSAYVDIEVEDEATDRSGEVVIYITASKAGNYTVYANHADAKRLPIKVEVKHEGANSIETVVAPQGNIALDTTFLGAYGGFTSAAFEITAADGTVIKGAHEDVLPNVGTDYKVTVVEAPADSALSDLEVGDLKLRYDGNTNNAWILFSDKNIGFDEEGKYVIKVTMESGDVATLTVNVVEFDEAVKMILTYESNTVVYGGSAVVKAVSYMDANYTLMTPAHPSYNADGYGNIKFAANGKAVEDVVEETTYKVVDGKPAVDKKGGTIKTYELKDKGDEFVGTTIEALAINEDLELVATATLTVVDKAAGLKYQNTNADIAVNNKLIVNTVDEDGVVVDAGLDKTDKTTTVSVYVLSAPANATYAVSTDVVDVDEVEVTFTASAAGEYKLQTVIRNGITYYSSVDTITVGGTTSQFEDVVVMSIGSASVVVNSDVKTIPAAPMIKDGRTFVPFRALAEAFGADVEWVEATQSVVAELNGVKVVMVIGEETYTIDGKAMNADVAPFINGASTMVPVRFVAEAFGITVTPLYAADGTVADVLFAK